MLDSPLSTNVHDPLLGVSVVVAPVVVVVPVVPVPIVVLLHVLLTDVSALDPVLYTSVARVDDFSSDSVPPELGAGAFGVGRDAGGFGSVTDAGDRVAPSALADGNFGEGTVTGGVGLTPPTEGVVIVAVGGFTGDRGTVAGATGAFGAGAFGVDFFIPRRPLQVVFHAASACRSRSSNPGGTARVFVPCAPGPLKAFEASDASAFARLLSAVAAA
jgi:hypothetical protein